MIVAGKELSAEGVREGCSSCRASIMGRTGKLVSGEDAAALLPQ